MSKPVFPTEAEVEGHPDAVAGLALLRRRLARYGDAEVAAFWEAVRRCYASAAPPASNRSN